MNASLLQDRVLNPSLDAQAHNDRQRQLLHRPETTEVDSLREAICAGKLKLALSLLDEIEHANNLERDSEREIAGYADTAVTEIRSLATSKKVTYGSGLKLARKLRPGLNQIATASSGLEAAIATMSVMRAIDGLTPSEVLRDAVTYQLGERLTAVLTGLVGVEVTA